MSRIKWNLDKLEEVKKQHDEFMESTEDTMNKGRRDLASMTEEVWEGEDGDMARELYDKLVYKQMPDTWKQLDDCNNAIQKAQKGAYEAKNFCNEFAQIFRDGTIPSDTNSSPCGGELMCDEESGEQLISSMDAASQNAANIKSKTETLESILASLETDEAKFDYASYTEAIKEQAQNVVDRTRIFNNALRKYMQKVDDLDRTLEKELLNATPVFVPEPFDPACLEVGEFMHMKNSDIVDSLEKHADIDIIDSFKVDNIKNILELLFGKKNFDISTLTDKDIEIAFFKLSEEKQKEVLIKMGFSKGQISSLVSAALKNNIVKSLVEIIKRFIESIKEKKENDKTNDEEAETTQGEAIYKRGDEGDEIEKIQKWLMDNGYYTNGSIDGKYGGNTELGIARFQRQHGLPITGYIDENTLKLLNELMESGETDPYQAFVVDMDYISENYELTEHQYKVLERLYNDNTLGLTTEKKNSMLIVAAELYALGMEDEFVIGVLANVEAEGTAGEFEKRESAWKDGDPEGINYGRDYRGGNIQAIGLQKTLELAEKAGEKGVYGMGMVQWTFYDRRDKLLEAYKTAMGYPEDGNPTQDQNYPTEEQCLRIEGAFQANEMETYADFKGLIDNIDSNYLGIKINPEIDDLNIYNFWKNNTVTDSQESAELAAYYVCLLYENPDDAESKARDRKERSSDFYDVLINGA